MLRLATEGLPSIFITELLAKTYSKGETLEHINAEKEKSAGQIKTSFQIVMQEDVPEKANIFGGPFVLSLKNDGTSKELCEARFVVQEHIDHE